MRKKDPHYHPSRQFFACDVVSTWIWGWNHVATSSNLNKTSHRRRISDVVLTRKNHYNVVLTSCLKRCWNQVEIALQLRWNHVEIMTLKHMKPFFNVVSTSVCYFSMSFQRWNNVVVPAGTMSFVLNGCGGHFVFNGFIPKLIRSSEIPRKQPYQIWMQSKQRFISYRAHKLFRQQYFFKGLRRPFCF